MSNYGGGYGGGNRYGGAQNPYAQQDNPYDQGGNQYGRQAPNPYAQQQPNPYAQQQQQPAPYAQQQQGNRYAQQGGGYNGGAQGGYGAGNEMEMGQMNGGSNAPRAEDPHAILNKCQEVNNGIDEIDKLLVEIQKTQKQVIGSTDKGPNSQYVRKLDNLNTEIMTKYRNYTQRVKKIKGMPGAGEQTNAPQVGRIDRRLKDAIQQFQQIDATYRKEIQADALRQYLATKDEDYVPSEEEKQDVMENPNSQIFSQALLSRDRQGQSRTALGNVQGRHDAIQKIERQVVELAQLFADMNVLVVQQEPTVARINEQSENVHQDVTNANTQLTGAVKKAHEARKKKWICLGIVVLIVIIIAAALAGYFATRNKNNNKNNNN